jgi:hypothetical protein
MLADELEKIEKIMIESEQYLKDNTKAIFTDLMMSGIAVYRGYILTKLASLASKEINNKEIK